jgi:murein DD-endopeptidase MepM/ murein hydrolase activator NlpD
VENEKSRILAQLRRYYDAKPGPLWALAGVIAVSAFGMVAAFGTAPTTAEIKAVQQPVTEQLATPQPEALTSADETFIHEDVVQRGDTIASLLSRLGVIDDEAQNFLRWTPEAAVISRQMGPGKRVTARTDAAGHLQSLTFPLNGGDDRAMFVERVAGGGFKASEQALALETQVIVKSGEIRYSLFAATDAAGIPDSIATGLADVFGGDIDFQRDIRKGDRFSVVYETVNHLGHLVRTGRILAAEFVNDGRALRAVWFQDKDGKGGYYTPDGKNVRKAFLRSPLEFSRITSGFSLSRYHPILHEMRAHKGIDYGAPIGTRVKATGDGVVEFAGWRGGYGRMIILRHRGQFSTVYGHLSRFAAGLRRGMRVAQGDVIGYVGMTGLATGPHLHYEFRVAGVQRNPLTIVLPTAPPLTTRELSLFRERSQAVLTELNMVAGSNLALLD